MNVKFMLYSKFFGDKIWWGREEGVPLHSLSGTEVPAAGRKAAGAGSRALPEKNSVKNLEVRKRFHNFATFFAAPAREAGDSTLKRLTIETK